MQYAFYPPSASGAISGSVTVTNFPASQTVNGTVTANQGTGGVSAWKVDGSAVTQPVSGTVAVSNFPGTQVVSGTVAISGTVPVSGTFFQATQPVSAAALPLPTGASTSALQSSGNTSLASIDTKLTSPLAVRATPVTPGALTVTQAAVAVGTSAVRLTVSGSAPSATRVAMTATMDPLSSANFYVGSSSVSSTGATRGIPLVGGQAFTLNDSASDYYVISDTASQTFFIVEEQ